MHVCTAEVESSASNNKVYTRIGNISYQDLIWCLINSLAGSPKGTSNCQPACNVLSCCSSLSWGSARKVHQEICSKSYQVYCCYNNVERSNSPNNWSSWKRNIWWCHWSYSLIYITLSGIRIVSVPPNENCSILILICIPIWVPCD